MFLSILAQSADLKCKLNTDQPVLVGVSGGADSLALMYGLNSLGYALVIAHLDHGIRPESAQDADFVQAAAENLGLRLIRQRVDVLRIAVDEGKSVEEAARVARYAFLFNVAREHKAQAVAVAHQADDQVETVLMHFLRGAGLSGLSGMAYRKVMPIWDPNIPLVRPMLDIWRKDVEQYLAEIDVKPRFDQSNLDQTYFRNRLRHSLIPELENYNPQFRQALSRTASVLAGEEAFLDGLAQKAWLTCCLDEGEGRVVFSRRIFLIEPAAIQRRLLRLAVSRLRPDLRDVGFEVVERALIFIATPGEGKTVDLAARMTLQPLNDNLVIKTWEAELPDGGEALLPDPGFTAALTCESVINLRNGWQLEVGREVDCPEDGLQKAVSCPSHEVWLDADRITFPFVLRGWREGERWQPLGMGGHSQKLSDYFINEKVPEHLRALWPLVCHGDEVVWVVGMRPAETVKVSGETKKVLRLKLTK